MRPTHFALAMVCLWLAAALPGQVKPLQPGTLIATTGGAAANRSVQIIDPFRKTATRLTIQRLNLSTEFPTQTFYENPISFLLVTSVGASSGNLYRIRWSPTRWAATRLNTTAFPLQALAVVRIGSTIYVSGSSGNGRTATNATIWSLPAAGNAAPAAYVRLGATHGALGIALNMVAVGTSLHVVMWDSLNQVQHWEVNTATKTPTVTRRGILPPSKGSACMAANVWATEVDFDPNFGPPPGSLVISGRLGDVLWRTPTGTNLKHRSYRVCLPAPRTLWNNAMAVIRDTGGLVLGDMDRGIDELKCNDGSFEMDTMRLALPASTWFTSLTYVASGAATNLRIGTGCKQTSGQPPCSYSNALPFAPNTAFALTLMTASKQGMLILGARRRVLDLTPFGAPGCILRPSLDLLLPGLPTATGLSFPLALPAWAKGVNLQTQCFVLDRTANSLGLVLSDARELRIR